MILRNIHLKDSLNTLRVEAQNEQRLILSIAARVGPSLAYMDAWVVVVSDIELKTSVKIGWEDIALDFEVLCADTKFRGALTMTRSIPGFILNGTIQRLKSWRILRNYYKRNSA
ncbi:MAG: hypothetical protein JKX72_07675 [Robiginitomaculum sp.]|nr:hypothetical protein [Robiginitomaculum sp.]